MAKIRFRTGPEPPAPPSASQESPTTNPNPPATGRVDVVVDTSRPRRPFRPGQALWRFLVGLGDWALVIVLVGVVMWAVGALTLRGYLPTNALTARIVEIAHWEAHVVIGFFAHHPRGGIHHESD